MSKQKQTSARANAGREKSSTHQTKPPRKQKPLKPAKIEPAALAKPDMTVVGIGASAGGLDAFRQFFTVVPNDTGMAFVLIQHLDPTHESLTAELLGKYTRMSVVQVEEEMRVEPNHVYVIPPNKYLTISGKTLHLSQPVQRRGVRVPIDFFFRSLADDQQQRAIGIILSGTGSDGTLGAGEIKAAGGIVMVQSPDTAQYRTEDDRIDGVVLTFIDITDRNHAREALQLLNESLERQVSERTKLLQLVHDITAFANQTKTVDEALAYAIERICRHDNWHAGHAYRLASDGSGEIVPTGIWRQAKGKDLSRLERVTVKTRYAMSEKSVICDVFRSAELQWVEDIRTSNMYPRHYARDLGVQAIIAFPLLVGQDVVGAIEFFSQQSIARDERFIDAIQNIGTQLSYVLARKASERQMAKVTLAERERLGHELHDSLGQQMSALGLLVESVRLDLADDSSANHELLEQLKTHIEKSKLQIRSLMVGLEAVNVKARGLRAALERLAVETSQRHGPVCRFEGVHDVALPDDFAAKQSRLMHSAVSDSGTRSDSLTPGNSFVAALSNRELEIFTLIGRGHTTREIVSQLHISPNTVGTHRERLKSKLKLMSSAELSRQATLWVAENDLRLKGK